MSQHNKSKGQGRRERLEQMRAEEHRRERRRAWLVYGATALAVLAIIAATLFGIRSLRADQQARVDAAAGSLEGLKEYGDLSQNHVETDVTYPQSPPVGGDHSPVWLNCGIYQDEVPLTSVVHSLEHGAVWLSYRPDLPDDAVSRLEQLATGNDYVVVSPYEGQDAPVVATAWGLQLQAQSADDPGLQAFVDKYVQGPQTPEPGAVCYGGVGA